MKEAKRIAKELSENLSSEEMLRKDLIAEQIRLMADENEGFANRIFEIGVRQVLKEFKKKKGLL